MSPWTIVSFITKTSYEHHGVWNHRQLDCLLNGLFKLTPKKPQRLPITDPWRGKSIGRHGGFPIQRAEITVTVSMSWCQHCPCSYRLLFHSSFFKALQWRHNGRDNVSNNQPRECLLSRLIWRRSKKTSKLRVTCLFAGNSPETGEFPAQRASDADNVSIWWRHHGEICQNATTTIYKQGLTCLNLTQIGITGWNNKLSWWNL